MKELKTIAGSLLLLLSMSCSKEQEGTSIATQQTNISTYLDALRKKGTTGITSLDDVYRVVLTAGSASKTVGVGDSVIFYYKAGTFSQSASDGFGKMFDTNIDSVAKNRKLDTTKVFTPYRAVAGDNRFIYGLEKGLLQMSEGEQSQLIFTSDHGYGDHAMSTIPKNTALIFEVTMVEVKKN